ncbi:MAG TPA: hypothetical protein VGS99_09200 [Gammaproteobacteria bacterium]|nr:hypothetical protein [Gammaproteobacteria bacterium]
MKRSPVALLVAGTLLLYPLLVYFAAGRVPAAVLLAGILAMLALRLGLVARARGRRRWLWAGVALLAMLAVASLFMPVPIDLLELRSYPVLIDAGVFLLFAGSLFTSKPLVERIARALEGELPPPAVAYTRRVTWVWSAALLLNTLVAAYTSGWTSLAAWAFYNGFLSYLLIGGLFAAEYLVRLRRRREWQAA